jgi:sugar O-acyltransferase (sialic acid O-acetyltransferase NeuD family)
MDKLVLVGTSSLAAEILDFIERYQLYEVVGFTVNESYIKENTFLGKPVFPIEELDNHIDKNHVKLFSTISWYNYLNRARKKVFDELKSKGYVFANLISPHAIVNAKEIGEGNWVLDNVNIRYGVSIGNDNVFDTGCFVSHYSVIGNHNFLCGYCAVAGHCLLGDRNFIGLKSTIYNRVSVGDMCVVGGNAIVKKDLPDFSLVVADNSFVKQCDEEKIESYISPRHLQRSVEDFNKLKESKM